MRPSAQATIARDPRRDWVFPLAGLLLVSALALAADPASAKEPLRPREAREVENGHAKASSATRARTTSSADRSDRQRARRGDSQRHARRHGASDRYRSDRHRADRHRSDRHRARNHHRDRYRSNRHHTYPRRHYRPYYRNYGYYSPYRLSSSYWLRYRPYYHYYGPFSVYPVGWPSVYVDARASRSGFGRMGAFDMDVKPEKAEIYVDGKYLGVADDYDGFPEYLWLETGTYDISIYAEGYETITRQYTVRPGRVIDVSDRMRPGDSVRPDERVRSTERRDERLERDQQRRDAAAGRYPLPRASEQPGGDYRADGYGAAEPFNGTRLFLEVLPDDAVVYLDGEFVGRAGDLSTLRRGLVVEPGQHTLEVVRPGYETESRDIVVPVGEPFELVIELKASAI